jgi:mannose-6-phosphate isomerase-like protein (cupin superfamily)
VDIRRFGVGYRRSDGPPGTRGASATSIHSDRRGVELALRPNSSVAPHSNANLTYLLVIEGGGIVQVGDEKARVAAGEAVVWPPDVDHAVWTELTPLRAIVVEFAVDAEDAALALAGNGAAVSGSDAAGPSGVVGGWPGASVPNEDSGAAVATAEGALAPKPPIEPEEHLSTEREPR